MLQKSLEILGVTPDSTVREVRGAYWAKAFKTHPDHDGGSVEGFQELVNAYQEVIKYADNVPCPHCVGGIIKTMDHKFRAINEPCSHCMGSGKRG